ncbi:MAG: hypothetical protein AAFV45_06415 [Pseudomonadota bacterium]
MTGRDVVSVKTMSLSRSEFDKSISAFRATSGYVQTDLGNGGPVDELRFDVASGHAVISYAEQASVTFGGLLKLPRAEVTIGFDGVEETDRKDFVSAFDIAFQRGGG